MGICFQHSGNNLQRVLGIQGRFTIKPEMVLSKDQTMAAGRILVHGFLLTCYLPIFIGKAQLYFILTGKKPSKSMTWIETLL